MTRPIAPNFVGTGNVACAPVESHSALFVIRIHFVRNMLVKIAFLIAHHTFFHLKQVVFVDGFVISGHGRHVLCLRVVLACHKVVLPKIANHTLVAVFLPSHRGGWKGGSGAIILFAK